MESLKKLVSTYAHLAAAWLIGTGFGIAGDVVVRGQPPAYQEPVEKNKAGQESMPLPRVVPPATLSSLPPLTPAGPSPFRADAQLLLIDLPTALRVVNASNPTIGVAQEVSSARPTRQRCLPVRLSSAIRNDCSSWSQLTISVSPWRAGELPSPCPCLVCISPRLFFQSSLPAMSRQ